MHPNGNLYVARFDFGECSRNGIISVLSTETGEVLHEISVAECPEITGLHFSSF